MTKVKKKFRDEDNTVERNLRIYKAGTSTSAGWLDEYELVMRQGVSAIRMNEGQPVIKRGSLSAKDFIYFTKEKPYVPGSTTPKRKKGNKNKKKEPHVNKYSPKGPRR